MRSAVNYIKVGSREVRVRPSDHKVYLFSAVAVVVSCRGCTVYYGCPLVNQPQDPPDGVCMYVFTSIPLFSLKAQLFNVLKQDTAVVCTCILETAVSRLPTTKHITKHHHLTKASDIHFYICYVSVRVRSDSYNITNHTRLQLHTRPRFCLCTPLHTPLACQVHVYATDPSSPTMDTSDSVGWFTVDMRDLAGQRRQERWVKLQGASPGEVLISSGLSLAVARDPPQDDRYSTKEAHQLEQQRRPTSSSSSSGTVGGVHLRANATASPHVARDRGGPIAAVSSARLGQEAVINVDANSSIGSGSVSSHTRSHSSHNHISHNHSIHSRSSHSHSSHSRSSGNPEDAAAAADAVSELDALPVGPGAGSEDAATFSLAISVKGAAGLSALSTASTDVIDGGGGGAGFWLSYSIFGVVVQTDRFDRLAPHSAEGGGGDGDGPVLEPMLDSFRLRATLQGLCQFFGEAPPLQVNQFARYN